MLSEKGYAAKIALDKIVVSEFNVRRTERSVDIDELAESIRRNTLLQPVIVVPKGDMFHLIIGQRRYLAVKKLGWQKIPAIILGELDPAKITILSLIENLHRRELPYRDMIDACDVLFEKYHDVGVIARELGVSEQTIQTYLSHRLVPAQLKDMVEAKKISRKIAHDITLATMDSIVKGDVQKSLDIAEKIAALPPKKQRKVIETAHQNPGLTAESIFQKAEKAPRTMRIEFEIPLTYQSKLMKASKDLDMEIEEVVKTALITWLNAGGFSDEDKET
jgi:ParB family chromosome partitioning protein